MKNPTQKNNGFVLLSAGDAALRNALTYLFAVILKCPFEATTEGDTLEGAWQQGISPELLLVHSQSVDENAIEMIKRAKSCDPSTVVVALQNQGSTFGARAFLAGADDVVDWPCSLYEFALRLFVRLGRSAEQSATLISNASWETEAYIAERAGLTMSEAQVMRVLYTHDGQIVSRDALSLAVDGRHWRYGDRKFDVHVAKIRKKLSDAFGPSMSVSTVRSLGYCMTTKGAELFGARRTT
ncbi:MAG: winged helix-turn-helix domain-containing protein [Pseudomonadota bacterium]